MKMACVLEGKVPGRDGTTTCDPVDDGDFCHGCKHYICDNHCVDGSVSGHGHRPIDHAQEEQE